MSRRGALTCLLLVSTLCLSVAFHVPILPGSKSVQKPALSGSCPSLRASRGNKASVTMGMRDKIKATLAALGAAFTMGVAPLPAKAVAAQQTANTAPTEQVQQQQPTQPMLLPSQVAHHMRKQNKGEHPYIVKAKKIAQDPKTIAVAGVVVAGGVGYVVFQGVNKKQTESFRKSIASTSKINIDASILDETRINRPGAKTVQFSNAPQFGSYRPPPEKLMKDVKDKYVWKKADEKRDDSPGKDEEDLSNKINLDIFQKKKAYDPAADTTEVELVDDDEGPKTADERALEKELSAFNMDGMDEAVRAAMAGDPTMTMDPAMMARALPALQEQLAELMKGGITREEVEEVKQSFREMGIDLDDMFQKIDEMEKVGLSDAVGPEGLEFFRTLKSIIAQA